MIEIRRWDNGGIIHSGKFVSVKECLEDGISKDVDFSYAKLYAANLIGANLCRANLTGAYLIGANLTNANLYEANLSEANLIGANLYGAILTGVNFYGANLCRANLTGAYLTEANLTNAKYSILSILKIYFRILSEKMTLELMRHDAEFIGEEAMNTWAECGKCPYEGKERDFYFQENRELWKPGKPKYRGLELWKRLAKENLITI